ncbi:MAG: hypothetical protein P1P82_13240 [Bacteroidales bacterium]|nr:hypothetical protein [Bacteroidales bacterium]MDT8432873.1 hypothetical protein [Bacteroidales bacterium]
MRLLSWFLLLLGIIFIFSGMYTEAAIFGLPGALTAVSYTGFNIDPEKMRIRKYDRFMWVCIGQWQPIQDPMYVTVVRVMLSGKRTMPLPIIVPQTGRASRTYKINLVVNTRERYIPLTYGNRRAMLQEGLKIATLLHIKLLDHTTSEKHWLA